MRKLVFITLLLSIGSFGNAQIIKGYLAGGINMAQVDGDEVYGYKKPGANLGLGALVPFGRNWDISLETSFTQKGANQKEQYIADTLNGAYKLKLDYVEIPLMIHYTDKDFVTVGAGASWSKLIRAEEWEHGLQTPTNEGSGTYKPTDISVILDLRMRIYKRLKFNFRYNYSMVKIRTRNFTNVGGGAEWSRHQYNNALTFRLIYIFNEVQSEKARKEIN